VKVVIVEDELLIAAQLKKMVVNKGHLVLEVCKSLLDFDKAIKKELPDMCFVDINLNGDANEAGIAIGGKLNTLKIPFTYITGNNEKTTFQKAVATKPESYLSKPFNEKDVEAVLDLAELKYYSNPIIVNSALGKTKISPNEILFIKSDNVYIDIHVASGKRFTERMLLKELEPNLPDNFIRVHRSYIVNKQFITATKGDVVVLGDVSVPLSKSHKSQLL